MSYFKKIKESCVKIVEMTNSDEINPKESLLKSVLHLLQLLGLLLFYFPIMFLFIVSDYFERDKRDDLKIFFLCSILKYVFLLTFSVIFFVINVFYSVFNLIENLLYYPSVVIDSFLQKIKLTKRFVLFLISLFCLCCLIFGNHWGINFHAALVAFCTFSIMIIALDLSEKFSGYKITDSTKLMYTLLSAAPALIVFWLESSGMYLFATNTTNILVLVIAVIMPTLLMACYFCADIYVKRQFYPAIKNPEIRKIVKDGVLSLQELSDLSHYAIEALEISDVRDMVKNGHIAMEQVLQISRFSQLRALQIPDVCNMVRIGFITMAQVLQISRYYQLDALENLEVCEMVRGGSITMEQLLQLSDNSLNALRDQETRQRLINALRDQETRQRIIAGDIAIEDIIGALIQDQRQQLPAPVINYEQSIHHSSVHKSVSASATNLMKRYGVKIAGSNLEGVIAAVKNQVSSLSDESDKNQAAKRCIQRLTAGDYAYTDEESRVTTRQLLALVFLAISDSGQRKGKMEDAMVLFVQGLYEIQRGYNLNDAGVDNGEDDHSICAGGTFNKLIEKLQGVHPDGEVIFRTRSTAALKLLSLVRRKAKEYLSQQAKADLLSFTNLIAKIDKDGLEVIYDQIRESVADDMLDEFGSLYNDDRSDQEFVALIDSGVYADPPNLDQFEEKIQNLSYASLQSEDYSHTGITQNP